MTEQATEEPAAPETEGQPTLEKLDAKVDRLAEAVGKLLGGGEKAAEAEEPASVAAEVQRELARLKQAEDRKAARDKEKSDLDAKLAALEDKVKEKPPREYRKVENWHKWRLPEDK